MTNKIRGMVKVEDGRIFAKGDIIFDVIKNEQRVIKDITEEYFIFEDGFKISIDKNILLEVEKRGDYYFNHLSVEDFKIVNNILYFYDSAIEMGDLEAHDIISTYGNKVYLVTKHKNYDRCGISQYDVITDRFQLVSKEYFDNCSIFRLPELEDLTIIQTSSKIRKAYNDEEMLNFVFAAECDLGVKVFDNQEDLKKCNDIENVKSGDVFGEFIVEFEEKTLLCLVEDRLKTLDINPNVNLEDITFEVGKKDSLDENGNKLINTYVCASYAMRMAVANPKDKYKHISFVYDKAPLEFTSVTIVIQKDEKGEVYDFAIKPNDSILLDANAEVLESSLLNFDKACYGDGCFYGADYLILTKDKLIYTNKHEGDFAYHPRFIKDRKLIDLILDKYSYFINFNEYGNVVEFVFSNDNYDILNVKVKKTYDRGFVYEVEEK